jgi:hypothetical protein
MSLAADVNIIKGSWPYLPVAPASVDFDFVTVASVSSSVMYNIYKASFCPGSVLLIMPLLQVAYSTMAVQTLEQSYT